MADTGLKLGSTDKTAMVKRTSALCKASFLTQFRSTCDVLKEVMPTSIYGGTRGYSTCSYGDLKRGCEAYGEARAAFLGAFRDWVSNDPALESFGATIPRPAVETGEGT